MDFKIQHVPDAEGYRSELCNDLYCASGLPAYCIHPPTGGRVSGGEAGEQLNPGYWILLLRPRPNNGHTIGGISIISL